MELKQFIDDFAAEFEMTDIEEFTPDAKYREFDEWDSLLGLSIIGMVKNKYGKMITGEEVKNAGTIEALFRIVESR